MVISKMNNVLVKHSRILFGLFTAVIIISFVWFFTPGASGNILFGTNPMSPNAVVGSVFEKDITRGELMDMVRDYSLLMAANYGVKPAMNGLDEQQIEEAFQRAVLLSVASSVRKSFRRMKKRCFSRWVTTPLIWIMRSATC